MQCALLGALLLVVLGQQCCAQDVDSTGAVTDCSDETGTFVYKGTTRTCLWVAGNRIANPFATPSFVIGRRFEIRLTLLHHRTPPKTMPQGSTSSALPFHV